MKTTPSKATVENGQPEFREAVQLPEQEIIHILLPELDERRSYRMMSARLAHPERRLISS